MPQPQDFLWIWRTKIQLPNMNMRKFWKWRAGRERTWIRLDGWWGSTIFEHQLTRVSRSRGGEKSRAGCTGPSTETDEEDSWRSQMLNQCRMQFQGFRTAWRDWNMRWVVRSNCRDSKSKIPLLLASIRRLWIERPWHQKVRAYQAAAEEEDRVNWWVWAGDERDLFIGLLTA